MAKPVKILTDNDLKENSGRWLVQGGPALPVEFVTSSLDTDGGNATPVYLAPGPPLLQDGSAEQNPIKVIDQALLSQARKVFGGPALPVYSIASAGSYIDKYISTYASGLIAVWPMNETSGLLFDNAEGTAAYDSVITGVALDSTDGFVSGDRAGRWDGANDYSTIPTAIDAPFNPSEGTFSICFKVADVGVWSDGVGRRMFHLRTNSSNRILVSKSPVVNSIDFNYIAGGVNSAVIDASLLADTGWNHFAITWSVAADEVRAYINGFQVGLTQTGLGAWAGSLNASYCNIGADRNTPTNVQDGYLQYAAIWSVPLSAAAILDLATPTP